MLENNQFTWKLFKATLPYLKPRLFLLPDRSKHASCLNASFIKVHSPTKIFISFGVHTGEPKIVTTVVIQAQSY